MAAALPWRTAWITGASSGIGRQLSVDLAEAGVTVAVSARSADALEELARDNANVSSYPVDVASRDAVSDVVSRLIADIGAPDLVILNAGIWQPIKAEAFDAQKSAQSIAVNYLGLANAIAPLLPAFLERKAGHIAIVASVAGYRGLPLAAAYAPSKAAAIALAETLALELPGRGVMVSLINPGFVDTPMTAVNAFPMPFKVSAEVASLTILRGLARGKFEIVFPWQMAVLMKVMRLMPNALFLRLGRRL